MKFKKLDKLSFCGICKSSFKEGFEIDVDRRFFNNIKICKDCALKIYKNLGFYFVPKGIKNINAEIKEVNKKFF